MSDQHAASLRLSYEERLRGICAAFGSLPALSELAAIPARANLTGSAPGSPATPAVPVRDDDTAAVDAAARRVRAHAEARAALLAQIPTSMVHSRV